LLEGKIPIEHFHEADMIVVGDAERCFQKLKHYADLGVDQLICYPLSEPLARFID
jgi:hypothetical protein